MSATFASSRTLPGPARCSQSRNLSSCSSKFALSARVLAAAPCSSRGGRMCLQVQAYRETEKIGDWRVKQMVDMTHQYFAEFITKGREELADSIFDENVVHKDIVWDASHPIAGIQGMKKYLAALRCAYPDFWVEIDQIGTCDVNSIFVTYQGSATNLGEYHDHKPSRHTSAFQGCNFVRFNEDRSKIKEIMVYRSAFAEDKLELGERELDSGNVREIRLRRLI